MKSALVILMVTLLAACANNRYQHDKDFNPPTTPQVTTPKEPIPTSEPISMTGNSETYRVLGKTYWVSRNPKQPYNERGIASWYGMKFHGYATANGEIYDVYQYTAAHKTLPLPSYVRVTRQDNGKNVVVRVNDRGPFHEGRIIDLSYQAAKHIGLDVDGTTPVTVTLLAAPHLQSERWVQVSALSNAKAAQQHRTKIQQLIKPAQWPVSVDTSEQHTPGGTVKLHRVRIGPVPEGESLNTLIRQLANQNITPVSILGAHQL